MTIIPIPYLTPCQKDYKIYNLCDLNLNEKKLEDCLTFLLFVSGLLKISEVRHLQSKNDKFSKNDVFTYSTKDFP